MTIPDFRTAYGTRYTRDMATLFLRILSLSTSIATANPIVLSGTVTDSAGSALSGVEIRLANLPISDTSGNDGRFRLLGDAYSGTTVRWGKIPNFTVQHSVATIVLSESSAYRLRVFDPAGRQVAGLSGWLAAGYQRLPLLEDTPRRPAGAYLYQGSIGTNPVKGRFLHDPDLASKTETRPARVAGRTSTSDAEDADAQATLDTLLIGKTGFVTKRIPLASYIDSFAVVIHRGYDRTWSMWSLPGTGQDASFTSTFGEDADYPNHPLSYLTRTDGTVQDLNTGLIWQQADGPLSSYGQAKRYCDTLQCGGHHDWRLPDAHEAFSIQDQGRSNPSLDPGSFATSDAEYWWSSTPGLEAPGRVWVTNAGGGIGAHDTTESVSSGGTRRMKPRCVRSEESAADLHRFLTLSDSIVLDQNTGLEWTRHCVGKANWESALAVVENLKLGGHDDWRLPDVKELRSINDESRVSPSLDTAYFPDAARISQAGTRPNQTVRTYWTSTTLENHPEKAWNVDFVSGLVSYAEKTTDQLFLRAVRGGSTR